MNRWQGEIHRKNDAEIRRIRCCANIWFECRPLLSSWRTRMPETVALWANIVGVWDAGPSRLQMCRAKADTSPGTSYLKNGRNCCAKSSRRWWWCRSTPRKLMNRNCQQSICCNQKCDGPANIENKSWSECNHDHNCAGWTMRPTHKITDKKLLTAVIFHDNNVNNKPKVINNK